MPPFDLPFNRPVRNGFSTCFALRAATCRHARPAYRVAADGRIDGSMGFFHPAVNQSEIGFLNLASGELLRQASMSDICLGHLHQTARLLVQTMDDSGSQFAADLRQVVEAMKQRVDHGSARARIVLARTGVYAHARGLVDD